MNKTKKVPLWEGPNEFNLNLSLIEKQSCFPNAKPHHTILNNVMLKRSLGGLLIVSLDLHSEKKGTEIVPLGMTMTIIDYIIVVFGKK